MTITYPDSSWMYRINTVYYWPYRDNQVTSSSSAHLNIGEHRYFRANLPTEDTEDIEDLAGAAGVWVRNVSCYEIPGGYFCEGYLEPKYAGVTIGKLAASMRASALEVSLRPSGFVDEALQDIDDYLTMDYHTLHPIRMSAPDDVLHPNSYYPVAVYYRGQREGAFTKPPPVAAMATTLREQGMGFYQPHPSVDPSTVVFILKTSKSATTPRQLTQLLGADAVVANLHTLNPTLQKILDKRYEGTTLPEATVHFFSDVAEKLPDAADISGVTSTLVTTVKYVAIGAAVLGSIWLGLKAAPYAREAIEGASRKRATSGA